MIHRLTLDIQTTEGTSYQFQVDMSQSPIKVQSNQFFPADLFGVVNGLIEQASQLTLSVKHVPEKVG